MTHEQLFRLLETKFTSEFQRSLRALGIPETSTYATADVMRVLDEMDFAINEKLLEEMTTFGEIPSPDEPWTRDAIFRACLAHDTRELWKPSPSRHDARKSRQRLFRESISIDELNELDRKYEPYDTRLLTVLLRDAHDSEGQELCEILLSRLNRQEAIERERRNAKS